MWGFDSSVPSHGRPPPEPAAFARPVRALPHCRTLAGVRVLHVQGRGSMALSSAAARPRDPRPDPAVSWRRNLLFVWVGVFVGLVGANFVFPFMPFYIQKLGISDTGQVSFYSGLSEGATGLSLTLTAPLWGAIADRFGRRPMFLRALLGAGILIGLMGIVINVWQLIALRFL